MVKVVDFLARVGSDASLRHASADTVETVLQEEGVDDEEFRDALQALMGQRTYLATQMPAGPEHEETEDPLDGEDEDGDGEPDGGVSHVPPPDASR